MGALSKSDVEVSSGAQALANEWIIPDASSEKNVLAKLLNSLKEAGSQIGGPYKLEVNSDLLAPRLKVAHDLVRKYGVLIDPASLSDQAISRLQSRKNYPRISDGYTLREWSDLVLGEGEHVDFYLPHSPRRNTHLGTVRCLSLGASLAVSEFLGAVQCVTVKHSGIEAFEDEQALISEVLVKEESDSVLREELESYKKIEVSKESIFSLLSKQAKGRWSPFIQNCIRNVEQSANTGSDAELVTLLLDCIDHSRKVEL